MRQTGNLDLLSFVGIRLLNWNVHVNRMDNKRTVSQEFKNNPQGGVLRGRPKTYGGTVYRQMLINAKLKTGKRVQNTELTRSSLRKRSP
jgi:hypothetical protein